MTQVIVDALTPNKLSTLAQPVDLLDGEGRVLGRFLPAIGSEAYEPVDPQASEEELDRRSRQGGGRPLAQILADLEKRE